MSDLKERGLMQGRVDIEFYKTIKGGYNMYEQIKPMGQNEDGTLTPPTSQEKTDLPLEGLNEATKKEMPVRMLTLDEADTLRAERTFKTNPVRNDFQIDTCACMKNLAYDFSMFLINHCPPSRQRSQALANLEQVVMWAEKSIDNNPQQ